MRLLDMDSWVVQILQHQYAKQFASQRKKITYILVSQEATDPSKESCMIIFALKHLQAKDRVNSIISVLEMAIKRCKEIDVLCF